MGVGDFKQDTFTDEEKAALGEAEQAAPVAEKTEQKEETKGPEPKEEETGAPEVKEPEGEKKPVTEAKTEPTQEEQAAINKKGAHFEDGYVIDEDGEKIPLKRFREVYREAKEGERTKERLGLIKKVGIDEFYRLHPEEKPEDYLPPEDRTKPTPDPFALVADYKDENHPLHGKTLREIFTMDAQEGEKLLKVWAQAQQKQALEKKKTETEAERVKKESVERNTAEAEIFAKIVAEDLFEKTDLKNLTPDEVDKINDLIKETYAWGAQNGKRNYSVADMWTLKRRVEEATAREKQGKALKSLETRSAVRSIGSGGETGDPTGFESYMAMTEDQLAETIDRMKDKDVARFFREAPQTLRKKHPTVCWG